MSDRQGISKNNIFKWIGFACLMTGVAYGVKGMSDVHNDVRLIYRGQSGPFTVVLKDVEGTNLRKTEFNSPPFEHDVVLPMGRYHVFFEKGGESSGPVHFEVDGDGPIVIKVPVEVEGQGKSVGPHSE